MKFTINMNTFSLRVLATVIVQEKTDEDTNVVYAVIFSFNSYFFTFRLQLRPYINTFKIK